MTTALAQNIPEKAIIFECRIAAPLIADDVEMVIALGHGPMKIKSISFTPDSAISGANTDSRTLSVQNKGTNGTGTTVLGSYALTLGNNIAACSAYELVIDAGGFTLGENEVLSFLSTHVGAGLVIAGGLITVIGWPL